MDTNNSLSLKQHDIAETLKARYNFIDKLDAIKFIKDIFGSTAELKDILIAYNFTYGQNN
jgi:FAD synthase